MGVALTQTRILVTGAAGFIGSHFCRWLLECTDWFVVGLDRLDEAGSLGRLGGFAEKYPDRWGFVYHDLKSPIAPNRGEALSGGFDYVVHMAAASHVDRSVKHPIGFVLDNVLGTANVLQWVRELDGVRTLLFSTDEVYGAAPPGVSYDELAPLWPTNPYAASKAAAEVLAPAWVNTYNLDVVVTRATNIYGPGQDKEKFIPMTIDKIRRGATVQIHTRGGVVSSRYYLYVDDVSRAVWTILTTGSSLREDSRSGIYNISGHSDCSNLEVAQTLARLMGMPLRYELDSVASGRPRFDLRYGIDDKRLRDLCWLPQVSIEEGLERTVKHGR